VTALLVPLDRLHVPPLKFWIFTRLFRLRADVCAPIATANQVCQCDRSPLAIKNWLVHPGSAPTRQTQSAPATTAAGDSNTNNIDNIGEDRV
jgi:hypothetical protein